jgi:hypothetical protein
MLLYKYIFDHDGVEFIFYAGSRMEAEVQFKDVLGYPAKTDQFLRREPW